MIVPEREKGRRVDFKKMQGSFGKYCWPGGSGLRVCGLVLAKSEDFFENFAEREGWTAGFVSRKIEDFFIK